MCLQKCDSLQTDYGNHKKENNAICFVNTIYTLLHSNNDGHVL